MNGDFSHRRSARGSAAEGLDIWRRETFVLPRPRARERAREFLQRFPREAYQSEVESWRELDNGDIEFTMRRLPTAD
ncbi:hypothetical protein [Afifella marina]|uniref:Uncharacterized protein n=1 Tax=Afifella marina DSM 2698 TaxID=1120955 RepID=A0A1G5P2F6_AFIMA|nr:hypothetical protein [Afifella marina]MBK1624212.1 hypothetical protein [Afifella marina DSM 2698]MBK1627945.1 hypothetical protein [Afifella marina]MBK5918139.1 hypothetical protein [Afifella marina]RAI19193.1 hypothetical protein CH311_12810 [Afifella marina DSM 2698]SCZ43694.1 hypothetical protein SAMN03080610_03107 [Afifella marina DSM 2698]